MQKKPNGLFSTRLVKEYEEQFNESPPSDIIEKLSLWPDVVALERRVHMLLTGFYMVGLFYLLQTPTQSIQITLFKLVLSNK